MASIYVRRATRQDVAAIMDIINEAKQLLKADGSTQWQDGYPNLSTIQADIETKESYVLIVDDQVAGTAYLMAQPEPTYTPIDGQWLSDDDNYATIHRIAIASRYRGLHLSSFFYSNLITIAALRGATSVRFDTHRKNLRMQAIGKKFGFQECGIIKVAGNDPERLAFELMLNRPR